ncbi:hypothetical protein HGRIS_004489 [Hohenbuehelia grisea]|uniref:Galactokinase n=1 Tax=Hohenbuehelia grisea TaxID=104357 RepID=A0ABR3JBZ6_9AGAR
MAPQPAQERIPVYTTLDALYANLGTTLNHAERWDNLAKEFVARFGRQPAYIARAPGRVNLIGKDAVGSYEFSVLTAIERDILIACAPRPQSSHTEEPHSPGSVVAENLHAKYTRQEFAPMRKPSISVAQLEVSELRAAEDKEVQESVHAEEWHLDINPRELRWESYVKAGYYGVLERYFAPANTGIARTDSSEHPIPADILVTGTVPAGSGLSSSAAMVVASTLAFLAINGKLDGVTEDALLTKGELVRMSMLNEKRVGVNSGGMDQAASLLSSPLSALYITFYPSLSAAPVPIPTGAVFVCANSLVVADKVVGARTGYNLRVVETLVGARVLARALGLSLEDSSEKKEKITYREVIGRYAGETSESTLTPEALAQTLEKLLLALDPLKPKQARMNSGKVDVDNEAELGVTMEEMIEMSGLGNDEFIETYLSWVEVEATHFQLYKRARHVLSEALRVLQFRRICGDAAAAANVISENPGISSEPAAASAQGVEEQRELQRRTLQQLGALMNESQASCSGLFQCSCPELDELTALACEAGAYGSRLTGAGWGGCTVSLVAESDVDGFIAKLREAYKPYRELDDERLGEAIFATKPSSGACVYKFT